MASKFQLPRRVALLAFGFENNRDMHAIQEGLDASWWQVDMRPKLKEQHGDCFKDGTWPVIQDLILSCEGFDQFAIDELCKIIDDPYRNANTYGDSLGQHGADVLIRMLECGLNALIFNVQPVFEARAFSMREFNDLEKCLENAKSWLDGSRGWCDSVDLSSKCTLYGYDGAGKTRESGAAFLKFYEYVEDEDGKQVKPMLERMCDDEEKSKKAESDVEKQSTWDGDWESTKSWDKAEEPVDESAKYGGTFDAQSWRDELAKHGVDQCAKDAFFLLAQLPHDLAKIQGNCIIAYLQTRKIRDASRLVHKWSIDARRQVIDALKKSYPSITENSNRKRKYEKEEATSSCEHVGGTESSRGSKQKKKKPWR